nr:unnamed protein product [Callosobruchus analis]
MNASCKVDKQISCKVRITQLQH